MSEEKYSNEDARELVPGTTAGPTSPGFLGPHAGSPTPLSFGAAAPPPTTPFTTMPGAGFGPMAPGMQVPMTGMGQTPGMIPGFTPQQGIPMVPIAQLPAGMVPGAAPSLPQTIGAPGQGPTTESFLYTQGYLTTQIGQNMRIEFLLGENLTQDRRGTLLGVGIDYIILREEETDDLLVCDLYAIKFATTYL